MVMDEPTTALDVLVQREILRQISQLRHEFGFSVMFITHDLPLLLEISDRIAIMREARSSSSPTPSRSGPIRTTTTHARCCAPSRASPESGVVVR
jgi:peptide/nickel transport system ATP-binding protein